MTAVMNRQNRPLYEATLDLLGADDYDLVLDIGCGNGAVLALLASRCGAALAGVDPSPDMVKAAASRNAVLVRQGRLAVTLGDASHLNFDDQAFTKAFSVNTVYFWDDLQATMSEIRRMLVPSGLFVNALYTNETLRGHPHTQTGYRFHDPKALVESAVHSGFEVNTVPVVDGLGYCLVCRTAPPITVDDLA